jgi:hypothetical protein
MAVGLLTSTLEKTSKIAVAAYQTAVDVYHTLQARNAVRMGIVLKDAENLFYVYLANVFIRLQFM